LAFILFLLSRAQTCPAQVQFQIGQNFTGSTLGVDSDLEPPDANGAAGPVHFVELVNGRYTVYSKTDGHRVKSMTDIAFWSQAGISLPVDWAVTDPRILFDPSVQRWFASEIDFDTTTSAAPIANHFLLAVSSTADPSGSWTAVIIQGDPDGTLAADFDTLGLDNQGVYLSADMFEENWNPVGPTLVSIPKAGLLGSTPTTNGYTCFGIMSYELRGRILQPAICVDGTGNGSILATGELGQFITNNTLVGFSILNVAGSSNATLTASTDIPVPAYTAPFKSVQPSPSPYIDDGDSRLSATVYEVQGMLYVVHGTEVDGRNALRWYRIDAASRALVESGTISDPVLDLYYPSIAANASGTVVIAFNGSSATNFISAYAVAGQTRNGVTAFGDLLLLKSGLAVYSDGSRTSRWGDYSATSVDPTDPTHFWTIQSYPSSSSTWSTQITELLATIPIPSLSIARSNNNMELSWPASVLGFQLEATTNLSTPNWSQVSQSASNINGQAVVQIPVTPSAVFFRLHSP
jgi:hypothetical protein